MYESISGGNVELSIGSGGTSQVFDGYATFVPKIRTTQIILLDVSEM
jgi:hypothetical protein